MRPRPVLLVCNPKLCKLMQCWGVPVHLVLTQALRQVDACAGGAWTRRRRPRISALSLQP